MITNRTYLVLFLISIGLIGIGQGRAQDVGILPGTPNLELLAVTLDKERYQAGEIISLHAWVSNPLEESFDVSIFIEADWIDGESVRSDGLIISPGESRVISIEVPTKEGSLGPKVVQVFALGSFVNDSDREPLSHVRLAVVEFPDQAQSPIFPIILVGVIAVVAAVVIIGVRGWS